MKVNHKTSIKQLRFFVTLTIKFSQSTVLSILQILKFITNSYELTVEFLSSRLNMKLYNRLDKEVADFKEPKGGPAVLYTTKCFYCKN